VFFFRIFLSYVGGRPPHRHAQRGFKLIKTFKQIKILQIGIVVKSAAAAVFFAAAADKAQMLCNHTVSVVHHRIYFYQRFSKRNESLTDAFIFG